MKNFILSSFSLFLVATLSGCGLVEDAFKAGVIFALIIAAIIGIIIWAVNMVASQINKRYSVQTVAVRVKQPKRAIQRKK